LNGGDLPDCEAIGHQAEVSRLILGKGLVGWSNSLTAPQRICSTALQPRAVEINRAVDSAASTGSEKNMHFILHSSTRTLVTMSISAAPKGGFHCKSVQNAYTRMQKNLFTLLITCLLSPSRKGKVHIARWRQRSTPVLLLSA